MMKKFHCVQIILLIIVIADRFPDTLQQRVKRQIVFPDDDNEERRPTSAQSPCTTPDRRAGDCMRVTSCPVLLRLNNYNRLRRFFCGFERDTPLVCCPLPPNEGRNPVTTPVVQPNRWNTRRPPITTTTTTTRRPQPPRRTTWSSTRRPSTNRRPTPAGVRGTTARPASASGRRMPNFLPQDCGKSNATFTRVVGGEEVAPGTWPWMTVVYQERRGVKSPDCGGALVTTQHVITAAHCVVGRRSVTLNPEVLSVRLGEHDLYNDNDSMNPVDVGVQEVIKHDDFNPRTYKNDIAILKLTRPVRFRGNIGPICLPYDDDELFGESIEGRNAFIAGWGTTAFNGPSSPRLMQAQIPIQEQEYCRNAYRDDVPITNEYMCAGMMDGTKDSCQGDSGGPLMAVGSRKNYYLVGIVSFGKLCGTPGYPGVYTRVTQYLDWIRPRINS